MQVTKSRGNLHYIDFKTEICFEISARNLFRKSKLQADQTNMKKVDPGLHTGMQKIHIAQSSYIQSKAGDVILEEHRSPQLQPQLQHRRRISAIVRSSLGHTVQASQGLYIYTYIEIHIIQARLIKWEAQCEIILMQTQMEMLLHCNIMNKSCTYRRCQKNLSLSILGYKLEARSAQNQFIIELCHTWSEAQAGSLTSTPAQQPAFIFTIKELSPSYLSSQALLSVKTIRPRLQREPTAANQEYNQE